MVLWKMKDYLKSEWVRDICYKVCEVTKMNIENEEMTFLTIKTYDV